MFFVKPYILYKTFRVFKKKKQQTKWIKKNLCLTQSLKNDGLVILGTNIAIVFVFPIEDSWFPFNLFQKAGMVFLIFFLWEQHWNHKYLIFIIAQTLDFRTFAFHTKI